MEAVDARDHLPWGRAGGVRRQPPAGCKRGSFARKSFSVVTRSPRVTLALSAVAAGDARYTRLTGDNASPGRDDLAPLPAPKRGRSTATPPLSDGATRSPWNYDVQSRDKKAILYVQCCTEVPIKRPSHDRDVERGGPMAERRAGRCGEFRVARAVRRHAIRSWPPTSNYQEVTPMCSELECQQTAD